MKDREYEDAIYSGLAKILKAIANPARLEIIELISQGEKCVEEIVSNTNLTVANASQHLQVLKNNNIVKTRREGHYIYYSIVNEEFLFVYQQIVKYAKQEVAELDKLLNKQRKEHHALNAVTLDELEMMMQNENIVLMDVRPALEYKFGHIPEAISLPVNDLLNRLKDLPKNKEIIAYCRGPFCALSDEAVKLLLENGFNAKRLDDGYPEWKIRSLEKTKQPA